MVTNYEKVLDLIRKAGVLRPKDLNAFGIPRSALQRLEKLGQVRRISRGLYEPADSDPTEHIGLVEICKRIPDGVVCLISALDFHGMTTQMPYEVWMAIGRKASKPRINDRKIRFVRFSGSALTYGVETHKIQGADIRITSPAKTVADCFKYRNKIGTDIAVEALSRFLKDQKGNRNELWKAAEICRVTNVMRPYLEAMA